MNNYIEPQWYSFLRRWEKIKREYCNEQDQEKNDRFTFLRRLVFHNILLCCRFIVHFNNILKISGNQIRKVLTDKMCLLQISRVSVGGTATFAERNVLKTSFHSVQVNAGSGRGRANLGQQGGDSPVQLNQVPSVLVWVKNILLVSNRYSVS